MVVDGVIAACCRGGEVSREQLQAPASGNASSEAGPGRTVRSADLNDRISS